MAYRLFLLGFVTLLSLTVLFSVYKQHTLPYISLQSPAVNNTPYTEDSRETVRIASVGSASARCTIAYYDSFLSYLEKQAGIRTELVLRKSYREIIDLLLSGQVEFAFISSSLYVTDTAGDKLELLLIPQPACDITYTSCIFVHHDSKLNTLAELRGKTFAFTDPDSALGCLYPTYLLKLYGESPESYFSSYHYVYSVDYAVRCVASQLVEAAAADSLHLQYLLCNDRELKDKIKIIHTSGYLPLDPLVAGDSLAPEVKEKVISLLLAMHEDVEGMEILAQLGFSRFTTARPEDYDIITKMATTLGGSGNDF
ncbi:MAG TPA: phosphate/phosphite/phosphonate ABC transporter substrate-binding protein [Firmicutes bacterium]|nr:phosphate/phosphite/phosphonate ABC transporter substrate-binding protein [Bacillota bacterium]